MTRAEMVLCALAAGGENASFSPVQVQKLFFLIDREGAHLVGGPHFAFAPYDYGPFDSQVYDEFDMLAATGYADVDSTGKYRKYSLTSDGYAKGVALLDEATPQARKYMKDVIEWMRGLNFQQLVASIYNKYPDMKVNSIFNQ